ncbi:replication initiator protein [Dipodfec virus UOA04_Rod_1094]|nr:replication initiator protein [Dipodfec virus UOA04_Rod_1094]
MCVSPVYLSDKRIYVPCGMCYECAIRSTTEWALRICLEAKQHKDNCCVTLTYNNEHLPENSLLAPRDLQLWLKRLRKAISPVKVRFFASGEYGSRMLRPHYHVILFGWKPDDLECFFNRKHERNFYTSKFVQDTWSLHGEPIGHILVGEVDWQTAFYTAKYLQKQLFKDSPVPPFVRMSNRPGIGSCAVDTVNKDLLLHEAIYFNGKKFRVPRYFFKVLENADKRDEFIDWEYFHDQRLFSARESARKLDTTSENFRRRQRKAERFFDPMRLR